MSIVKKHVSVRDGISQIQKPSPLGRCAVSQSLPLWGRWPSAARSDEVVAGERFAVRTRPHPSFSKIASNFAEIHLPQRGRHRNGRKSVFHPLFLTLPCYTNYNSGIWHERTAWTARGSPVPCSLFPVPCSLLPVPCSLLPELGGSSPWHVPSAFSRPRCWSPR